MLGLHLVPLLGEETQSRVDTEAAQQSDSEYGFQ